MHGSKKLVMVTVNGITVFIMLKPDTDGQFRLLPATLKNVFNITANSCFSIG